MFFIYYQGPLRNPMFCNILIALYKEIYFFQIEKIVFYVKVLCLLLGTPNSKHGTLILKTTSGVYYCGVS